MEDNLQRESEVHTGTERLQSAESKLDLNFIQKRATEILTGPKTVWPKIKSEPDTVASIYKKYLIPMAAIPPVCGFIGQMVFGIKIPYLGTIRPTLFGGLVGMVTNFLLSLALIYVCARILAWLAPKFEAQISETDAVKTVGYSMTPGFVAGFFSLVPVLGILGALVSFYGLYIFYHAVKQMTGVPESRSTGLFATTLLVNFCAAIVFAVLLSVFTPDYPTPHIDTDAISQDLNVNSEELKRSVEHFQKAFEQGKTGQ